MIVNDNDAIKRLNSPMNLMNKLKSATSPARNNAMQLFGVGRSVDKPEVVTETKTETKIVGEEIGFFNPFKAKESPSIPEDPSQNSPESPNSATPVLDSLLNDSDTQIKLGLAHENALDLLNNSITTLAGKLDDVKADRLPLVVRAAGQIITDIRRQQIANKSTEKEKEVHYHFYTPEQKSVKDYQVIDVTPA